MILGLPDYMDEEMVMDLLSKNGELKSFHLVKEKFSNDSKGQAFCQFSSDEATRACLQNYNGIMIGSSRLCSSPVGNNVLQIKRAY